MVLNLSFPDSDIETSSDDVSLCLALRFTVGQHVWFHQTVQTSTRYLEAVVSEFQMGAWAV